MIAVALTRFQRTLKYARQEVRELTHTLRLPPAYSSEIYRDPRPVWLRKILDRLPCLQSLMVSGLPFFDHNAMLALRNHQGSAQYNLRLLLADHEPNTTSAGLAETLPRFPLLTYLDLSYTTPARDRNALSSLSQLRNLRVLKLRGIGLKDHDAELLSNAIGARVCYLDLRNNLLTDMALRSLLQASFIPPSESSQSHLRQPNVPLESVPWTSFYDGTEFMKSPELDEIFLKLLAQPASNRPWIEDLPRNGITHLYIANNRITVEGIADLLASSRLCALDAGTVNSADVTRRTISPIDGKHRGAEKLVPLLGNVAGENLRYLRAHHTVLTAEPPPMDATPTADVSHELGAREVHRGSELDVSQEVHGRPGEAAPSHKLAGTSRIERPGTTEPTNSERSFPPPYRDNAALSAKRESEFAPEVTQAMPDETDSRTWQPEEEDTLRTTSVRPSISKGLGVSFPLSPAPIGSPSLPDDPRTQKIQELLAKRPRNHSIPLRDGKETHFPYLHPSHIPHLETLVLTDVPSHIPTNSPVLYTFTRFITACSNEALLATLQAGSDYSLPPGQARMRAEQQRAHSLFGLRRIILEITPTKVSSGQTSWKTPKQSSSTGDRDSENLWAAAADDFSFFEEECNISENDPMAALNEKVSLVPSDDDSIHSGPESSHPGQQHSQNSVVPSGISMSSPSRTAREGQQQQLIQYVDVVAELAAFRRAKKADYEQVVRRERERRCTNDTGMPGPLAASRPHVAMAQFVEGHWNGDIRVVRNSMP